MLGRRLRTTAYLVAACAGLLAPAAAHAQTTPPAAAPAVIARVDCAAACGGPGAVRPGSLVRVRGRVLARADQVVFMGGLGEADDVLADVVVRRKTSADVKVPLGALSGPVAVVDLDGAVSAASAPLVVESLPPGSAPAVELGVRTPRFYYDAAVPATLRFVVHGAPAPAAVDVAREDDGVVVAHWDLPSVAPEVVTTVTWDGLAGGKV